MAIQTLKDTGPNNAILSSYDGAVYDVAVGSDCVIGGIGDEFAISYSSISLDVSFAAGSEAIIGGNFFKTVGQATTVRLQANSTIYLCARINTSQPAGQTGAFYQNTSSSIRTDEINSSGTIRDLLLYVITTNGSGVTNIQDRRIIRGRQSIKMSVSGSTLNITLS